MTTASFQAARVGLEHQRQEAHRLAREAYMTARAEQLSAWSVAKSAIAARLERAKTKPAEFAAAQVAMTAIEQQPSPRRLLSEMERSIALADRQHHDAVRALARLHSVHSEG